jgi:hypothetical protein
MLPPVTTEPPALVTPPLPAWPPVPDDEPLFEDELQAREPRTHAKAAKTDNHFMRNPPLLMVSLLVLRASGIVALTFMVAPRSAGAMLAWHHCERHGQDVIHFPLRYAGSVWTAALHEG